jgi:hypothetical protein
VTITIRTLCLVVALIASAMGAGLTLLVHRGSSGAALGATPPQLEADTPTVVTPDELASLSSTAHPVYWAGSMSGRRLEVTSTGKGTFVRYLPAGMRVGLREQALTVATYELADAWDVAQQAAGRKDARKRALADGTVAIWRTSRPTNVYLARPDSTVLVEIFDPDAASARRLSVSGQIQPVTGH